MSKIRFTEQLTLSALHNLENPNLSDAENQRLYGICYRKHGHDYHIQVQLEANIDARTGIAVDRLLLRKILNDKLFKKFNGTFLNDHFDCTSGEALSHYFYQLLQEPIETGLRGARLVSIHIQETRKNWFSYSNL